MNLALIGFMGAGKTTVGRRLARMTGMQFADSDAEITRVHGPIPEIFASRGETQFRAYEREALERLCARDACVIAVGGGAVLDEGNRALLRRRCLVVHLAISPEAAHARVAHRAHRPLLGEAPSLERVRTLLAERADAYAHSDLRIAVDDSTAGRVAGTIARWYRARSGGAEPSR
ncbi:MAG TPA: shikimate kinase [Candidatus Eremiobacteraceae bacterium]|jgi:shikimate kinase|nr:shikimate kinase [Candidatus Eremiobacteraceae bacterium]